MHDNNCDCIFGMIRNEIERAEKIYPEWPIDPIHAAAICAEESGELVQAALDHSYKELNHKGVNTLERMKTEAIQTAAMAVRFLRNIEKYSSPPKWSKDFVPSCHTKISRSEPNSLAGILWEK
jgi:hypothetical protein